ncbi:unnamed protein product [Clavelina lepadiformis]|uniref:PWWP domain-containing protein n=1 Tax=Clavelina lepadiformis TaxID=159417 RepID=A0ABP0FT11_CLALP
MAKRTHCDYKKNDDTRRKRRKISPLPDLEDDDLFINSIILEHYKAGNTPSSNFEGVESTAQPLPTSVFEIESNTHESKLDENTSDEELESVESILGLPATEDKPEAGDLAWMKHSSRTCLRPAYVKSVSDKNVFALNTGHPKFTKKDKGFSSGVKSKNIRRFYTKDYQEIEEERKGYFQEKDRKKEEKENKKSLVRFNKWSLKIVKFILDGNCHSYLLNILQRKRPSRRMNVLATRWENGSVRRLKTKVDNPYFEDNEQLETVCFHLSDFIQKSARTVTGFVQRGDLLFDVFLPESIIYSIHKLQRRDLKSAEKIFREGCKVKARKPDPLLNKPLTDEQRALMEYKLKDFAKEIKS